MATCPECLARGIRPSVWRRTGHVLVHGYECPTCGHTWTTRRLLPAYAHPAHRSIRKEAS